MGGAVTSGGGPSAPDCIYLAAAHLSRMVLSGSFGPRRAESGGRATLRRFDLARREAKDVPESRPADRRRRYVGHACPGAVAAAAAAVSSITDAARHAGGAGSLRPRCAQILRFRPAGYD